MFIEYDKINAEAERAFAMEYGNGAQFVGRLYVRREIPGYSTRSMAIMMVKQTHARKPGDEIIVDFDHVPDVTAHLTRRGQKYPVVNGREAALRLALADLVEVGAVFRRSR